MLALEAASARAGPPAPVQSPNLSVYYLSDYFYLYLLYTCICISSVSPSSSQVALDGAHTPLQARKPNHTICLGRESSGSYRRPTCPSSVQGYVWTAAWPSVCLYPPSDFGSVLFGTCSAWKKEACVTRYCSFLLFFVACGFSPFFFPCCCRYYCCRCGKKQDAVKRCCLVKDQLPFVLCLTLKRFVRGQSTYKVRGGGRPHTLFLALSLLNSHRLDSSSEILEMFAGCLFAVSSRTSMMTSKSVVSWLDSCMHVQSYSQVLWKSNGERSWGRQRRA